MIYATQQYQGKWSRLTGWLGAMLLCLVLNGPFASAFAEALPPELIQELTKAEQAFQDGQYQEAMTILRELEADNAGLVEFDYLYGRTALELGDLNTAIAAFSRVLSLDPSLAGARLELARTYYSKGVVEHSRGSFEQAKAEFENVMRQKPPAAIRAAIKEYLVTIDKYLEVRHLTTFAFVEMTVGYDSNVNNATSSDYFDFFDIYSSSQRTVKLFESSQRTESGYAGVKAQAGIVMPLFSKYFELFGRLQAGGYGYSSASHFNNLYLRGEFGAHHYGDDNKKTFSINFRDRDMDGRRYANEFFINLEWAKKLDESHMVTARLVGGDANYNHEYWPMSVEGGRFSVELTGLGDDKRKSAYQFLILKGHDGMPYCDTGSFCNAFYERDISGMRFALSKNVFDQSRLYTSLYIEHSKFMSPFFDRNRNDIRYELFAGMNTPLSKTWQIRPELQFYFNDSSIDIFTYKRVAGSISIRWGY